MTADAQNRAPALDGTDAMAPQRFFSPTYESARAAFLEASARAGAPVTHHRHPEALGPEGDALFVDCASLGRNDAPHVVIVQSGTHGAEGFCGSGCQVGLLQDACARELPQDVKLVLIHGLNPYGFAWMRRVNEDNIDINRNFVDHTAPYPDNPGYEDLADAIAPSSLEGETIRSANGKLKAYAETHGVHALQSAITAGQYRHADGLYFGGTEDAWSNRMFRRILTDEAGHAEHAVLIDIHTGLGEYGQGELILEVGPEDPAYGCARSWWGDRAKSTLTGESVSAVLSGTIDRGFIETLSRAKTTPVALEFGTYSPAEVFQATRADNWLHTYGDLESDQARAIKAEIRRVFYPDTDDWKAMVWEQTRHAVARAIDGIRKPV